MIKVVGLHNLEYTYHPLLEEIIKVLDPEGRLWTNRLGDDGKEVMWINSSELEVIQVKLEREVELVELLIKLSRF